MWEPGLKHNFVLPATLRTDTSYLSTTVTVGGGVGGSGAGCGADSNASAKVVSGNGRPARGRSSSSEVGEGAGVGREAAWANGEGGEDVASPVVAGWSGASATGSGRLSLWRRERRDWRMRKTRGDDGGEGRGEVCDEDAESRTARSLMRSSSNGGGDVRRW